jgi:hypothetical protein
VMLVRSANSLECILRLASITSRLTTIGIAHTILSQSSALSAAILEDLTAGEDIEPERGADRPEPTRLRRANNRSPRAGCRWLVKTRNRKLLLQRLGITGLVSRRA